MRTAPGGWWPPLVLLLATTTATSDSSQHQLTHRQAPHYTNEFAVVVPGGRTRAERAARQHGCFVVDTIGELTDHYLLECHQVEKRSTQQSHHHVNKLRDSEDILWADQQYYKKRKKRDGSGYFPTLFDHFRGPLRFGASPVGGSRFGGGARPHAASLRSTQAYWPDPLFKDQWYLNGGAKDGSDMNVIPAWQSGYSGKGVVVSILDDGIQPNHPDLVDNYDGRASLDINDNDDDPTPRDDGTNRHGTRCAGEVAGMAGNTICGVGVAPNASIGGVRMLDGGVNDYVEAKALSYQRSYIDIYSASWGPEDDGKTVDGPGPLARRAFIEGVLKGRDGKGSIFVWASGNGGQYVDNCNCDGYTNSIFTLSISSASQAGKKPWYLEECASTLATTYSSGTPLHDKSIATCDQDAALRPSRICTVSHTGTSASAPLAAGLCALALEANPSLTWRDMQYIVLMTSRYEPLAKERDWITNGVGRKVSHKFGYGLMDGGAMVELAKRWTSVPAQHICITPIDSRTRMIPKEHGGLLRVPMDVTACQGTQQTVNHLEHVQCKVTLTHVPRGNLRILLTSPSGTESTLLFERPRDVTGSSFDRWPFMSVHFWEENPRGTWTLTINNTHTRASKTEGVLKEWQLILYGTEQEPIRLKSADSDRQFGTASSVHSPVVSRSDTSSEPRLYCSRQCVLSCLSQPAGVDCKRCRERYKSDCRRSCQVGMFYGGAAGCLPCHNSCGSCFGGQQNQCLDCARGHYLITDLSVCVAACPDGYFSAVNETCEACGPHCVSCEGSSNRCLSCAPHLILHDHQCVASCPAGTYEVNERCQRCAAGCETCMGPSDHDCVLCAAGRVHQQGRCVSACSEGTYADREAGECRPCWPGCDRCAGPSDCLACARGYEPDGNGRCRPSQQQQCGPGQFYSEGTCQPCHRSCSGCSGPSSADCSSCPPHSSLHNGLCYRGGCPEGLFTEEGVCRPCHHTCRDCRRRRGCSVCRSGLLLFNDSCLTVCPAGTYQALEECVPCAPACQTCLGPRGDQCASCPAGQQLVSGSCRSSCPAGSHLTAVGCRRCHRTCRTCHGSDINSCDTCHDGYQLLVQESTCVSCGRSEYFEPRASQCRPCHRTCGTCQGAGAENCTSCLGELRLEVSTHRCLSCCDWRRQKPDISNCCTCDPSGGHCLRDTRRTAGTRRRTAEEYVTPLLENKSGSNAFRWFYMQATVLCIASVACFALIFGVLQCRGQPGGRYAPVLELTEPEGEERLALTQHQHGDHLDELSDEENLVVYDSRT